MNPRVGQMCSGGLVNPGVVVVAFGVTPQLRSPCARLRCTGTGFGGF